MAMGAVGRAAMSMIEEVRRQFRDIPELKAALEVLGKAMKQPGLMKINQPMKLALIKQNMADV